VTCSSGKTSPSHQTTAKCNLPALSLQNQRGIGGRQLEMAKDCPLLATSSFGLLLKRAAESQINQVSVLFGAPPIRCWRAVHGFTSRRLGAGEPRADCQGHDGAWMRHVQQVPIGDRLVPKARCEECSNVRLSQDGW